MYTCISICTLSSISVAKRAVDLLCIFLIDIIFVNLSSRDASSRKSLYYEIPLLIIIRTILYAWIETRQSACIKRSEDYAARLSDASQTSGIKYTLSSSSSSSSYPFYSYFLASRANANLQILLIVPLSIVSFIRKPELH